MSLLDALNLKNDFSVCNLLGRLLEIFAPWNENGFRPVSVLTSRMTKFLLFCEYLLFNCNKNTSGYIPAKSSRIENPPLSPFLVKGLLLLHFLYLHGHPHLHLWKHGEGSEQCIKWFGCLFRQTSPNPLPTTTTRAQFVFY